MYVLWNIELWCWCVLQGVLAQFTAWWMPKQSSSFSALLQRRSEKLFPFQHNPVFGCWLCLFGFGCGEASERDGSQAVVCVVYHLRRREMVQASVSLSLSPPLSEPPQYIDRRSFDLCVCVCELRRHGSMRCLDTARTSGHSNWHSSEEEKEQEKKGKDSGRWRE